MFDISAEEESRDAPNKESSDHTMSAETRTRSIPHQVRQLGWMAFHEYRLTLRNRWAIGLTVLFGSFVSLLLLFSGSKTGTTRIGPVIASIVSLATYLVPLAALAFGHTIVVGADEQGWLDVLFALPTPRWIVLVGKFLGRSGTFAGATAIGFGVAGVVLLVRYTIAASLGLFATLIFWTIGLGLAFLAISTLLSTIVAERTHALGLNLLTWLWFVLIHDLVALGIIASLDLRGWVLSLFVLLNPADIYRVLVLRSAGAMGGAFATVFAETELSTPLLSAAVLLWIFVPISFASFAVRFRQV